MKRRYQEIWELLLTSKGRKLAVRCEDIDMHARIIKGVFKEKDLDKKNRKKWRLEARSEGDIINFKLREKINIYTL